MFKNYKIDKTAYLKNKHLIKIGENTHIDRNVLLIAGLPNKNRKIYYKKNHNENLEGKIIIGKNCHIAPNCIIQGHGGVFIGNNTGIASGTKIYSLSHHYRNLNNLNDSKRYLYSTRVKNEDQFLIMGSVYIGDNCLIGLNCILLPGAFLKNNGILKCQKLLK